MRRFISQPHIVLYFLFLLLLTTSCSPKLDEKITAYQEAHNSGDIEKEMSFFAEDIIYDVIGQWKVTGKESLKKRVEIDVFLNSHVNFTDIKSSKNKVTCKVEEQNDLLKVCGIDTIYYEFREFIFEDGLIKEAKTQLTQEGVDALRNVQRAFGKWAAENRREEVDELKSVRIVDKDIFVKWLALMRAWREEMDKEEQQEESEKEVEKLDLLNVPPDSKIDSNSTTQR
jgi:DNA-directed RNA polymerase subunit F